MEDKKLNTFSTIYEELNALNKDSKLTEAYEDRNILEYWEGLATSKKYTEYFQVNQWGRLIWKQGIPVDIKVNFYADLVGMLIDENEYDIEYFDSFYDDILPIKGFYQRDPDYSEEAYAEICRKADAKILAKYPNVIVPKTNARNIKIVNLDTVYDEDVLYKVTEVKEDGTVVATPVLPLLQNIDEIEKLL